MSAIEGQPPIADGICPKDAIDVLNAIEAAGRELRQVVGALCLAYDGELHRRYGYEFCRALPDASTKLAVARARWTEAVATFKAAIAALECK